jgi:hypothetical protein
MAMSDILIEIFHKDGITFDSVPEKFESHLKKHSLRNDERFVNSIVQHDYASNLLKSFSSREVDFFKNDSYYMIEENNKLTKIDFNDVMLLVRSAMKLYELWYKEWKNH